MITPQAQSMSGIIPGTSGAILCKGYRLIKRKNMTKEFIEVETDADETTLRKLGEAAMSVAIQRGSVEVSPGVFLYDNKTLIESQKRLSDSDTGKGIDYNSAPFWILVSWTGTVSPCDGPMDVIDFFDKAGEPA